MIDYQVNTNYYLFTGIKTMAKHLLCNLSGRGKKLFCKVAHICNLVQEFNGLVSKGVNRKIGPFYLLENTL